MGLAFGIKAKDNSKLTKSSTKSNRLSEFFNNIEENRSQKVIEQVKNSSN